MKAKQKDYHNPYDFMNPVRDPMFFAGRHGELEEIEYYLKLTKNDTPKYVHLALVGPRTAGKTSFLKSMANDLGYLAVKIPLNRETAQNDVPFFKEVFDGMITEGAERGLYGGMTGAIYKAYRKVVDRLDAEAETKIPWLHGSAYIGFKRKKTRGFTSCKDIALEVPVAPSPRYLQYIINGLKEVYPLTPEDIVEYLASKPGIKDSYTREELAVIVKEGAQNV